MISGGFHHSLSAAAPRRLYSIKLDSSSESLTAAGREKQAPKPPTYTLPPSAAANDDAPPGLEQNCVREIYTLNTPGAVEPHGAPKKPTVTLSLSI